MPSTGRTSSQRGSLITLASLAYGKLETIAMASSTTPATTKTGGSDSPSSTLIASTVAAIVVGTPQKKRPSFGETLNRARRMAAHAATMAQAATRTGVATLPDRAE